MFTTVFNTKIISKADAASLQRPLTFIPYISLHSLLQGALDHHGHLLTGGDGQGGGMSRQ